MGRKKRLSGIINAVTHILGTEVERRRLKKRKALRRFVKQLERRAAELRDELESGSPKASRERLLREHLEVLEKQSKKARALLERRDD